MTDPLFGVRTPVFTVDGELVRDLARDCVRLEVEEGVEGLRTVTADLVAVGPGATGPQDRMRYLDGVVLDFGRSVRVSLGEEGDQLEVFDGTLSGLEAVYADGEPPRVRLYAEDALMRLRMTRRSRTYTNVTDAEIASQLAREHGLSDDVALDGPRYDVVQQFNQSDLAFLRERARLTRAELWCVGRTLHLSSRPRRQGTRATLVQGNDLLRVSVLADLAHQRSEVVVTGYDAATESVIHERAGTETIDSEVPVGRTGPQIVASALGGSRSVRVREVALTAGEATAWARAEMLRRARGFVSVRGLTRGTPALVVGSIVRLELVGTPFDGDGYYVTRVRHTFDNVQGLRTRFEAERASINEAA